MLADPIDLAPHTPSTVFADVSAMRRALDDPHLSDHDALLVLLIAEVRAMRCEAGALSAAVSSIGGGGLLGLLRGGGG